MKGLFNSQRVLLSLTQKGMSIEESYEIVQQNAMKVWDSGLEFFSVLQSDPRISAVMSSEELESCFDWKYHSKHVNTIFSRVFKA